MTERVNPYGSTYGPESSARQLIDALERVDPTVPVGRIRGKFYLSGINLHSYGAEIEFAAVSRGARNAEWASATPSGSIKLNVNNMDAVDELVKALKHKGGPEFFVDFTHAPLAWPEDGHEFVPTRPGHYNHPRCAECAQPEDEHAPPDTVPAG